MNLHSAWIATLVLTACFSEHDPTGSAEHEIRGGTVTPVGQLEAVGRLNGGGCTGTLITSTAVLTAGHCVCSLDRTDRTCLAQASLVLDDVRRVGSSIREDVTVSGEVFVHPLFDVENWVSNDYALVRLSQAATELVQVAPLAVEVQRPVIGQLHTLVGYGGTEADCATPSTIKRHGSTVLDEIRPYGHPLAGERLMYVDSVGTCAGDSGGPALLGTRVVGVASTGDLHGSSEYVPTSLVTEWLENLACPTVDRSRPDSAFCRIDPLCPCASGEGDCDSTAECRSGAVCVDDVGAASGLPATMDTCWDSSHLVTAWSESGLWGRSRQVPVGSWSASTLASVQGVSSLAIPPGWVARACTGPAGTGSCAEFAGQVAYVGATLNDHVGSLVVQPGVTTYRDLLFGGVHQTFAAGSTYNHTYLTTIGNDTITSLIVAPGVQVRLCSESGAWGDCQEYTGRVSYVGPVLDDRTSSIEVHPGATVYDYLDYRGPAQAFRTGTYDAGAFSSVGDNRISSLVVAPGMKAQLCTGAGGSGTCKTFTGWVADVGRELNNAASWIRVSLL